MTPEEYAAIIAAPLTAGPWRIPELTPAQYAGIIAALATAGQTNHLQTGGTAPTVTYQLGDGGSITAHTGTDSAGSVQITSGTGTFGTLFHVAFAVAFSHAPAVECVGIDQASANLAGWVQNVTAAGFDFACANTAAATTPYNFAYVAVGAPN